MENRFGVKDFFLFLVLIILIVMVGLAMKQFDRQWDEIQSLRGQVDKVQKQLADSRGSGGFGFGSGSARSSSNSPISPATQGTTSAGSDDPFTRLHAAQAMADYATGDWIVDAFPVGVAKLTPLLSGDVYAARIQGFVLESLAVRDPDTLLYKPLLSTGWTVKDTSAAYDAYAASRKSENLTDDQLAADPKCPDSVVITFTMRDGVTFSDGEPLTADDVVFSYDFAMNEKIADPRTKQALRRIRKVEKVGGNQVAFHFAAPYFLSFDLASSLTVLPQHFYGKIQPEEFNQSVGFLMGSGPYRLEDPKKWKPGTLIQLFRNENYWGVKPAANRLVYHEITNDVAYLTAFRNGDIDLFSSAPDQYVRLIKDEGLMKRASNFEYLSPTGGYRFIAWNEMRDGKPTRFADKRVRQAMAMLVDKKQMMEVCSLGYAVEATGPFSPLSKQCDPAIKEWPYDVARGKQLLVDAGYTTVNDQGQLLGPDGKPFSFKLTYPSGSAAYEKMILFLKDSYARAGIELVPDPLQWAVFTDRLNNKNFDTISLGWSAGIENDVYQMFDSANMIADGDDFMSYSNPDLDHVLEQARKTIDESARMPLWRKAHAIIHEDQPYFFLWYGKSLAFVDKRIHNVQITKVGMNDRTEWFIPADQQHWEK